MIELKRTKVLIALKYRYFYMMQCLTLEIQGTEELIYWPFKGYAICIETVWYSKANERSVNLVTNLFMTSKLKLAKLQYLVSMPWHKLIGVYLTQSFPTKVRSIRLEERVQTSC